MTSLFFAALVFCLVCGGAMLGLFLQGKAPPHHRDRQSKETVQLVMGLVATMAALVLSLLIASTHTFYDTQQAEVQKLATDVVLLDEALRRFGPDTKDIRQTLLDDVVSATRRTSPDEGVGSGSVAPVGAIVQNRRLFEAVQSLQPTTPAQQFDQSKAIELLTVIASMRLLIHEQATSAVPVPLVVVMVIWLTLLFVGFGFFARAHATVLIAVGLGAFSVAAAIFLILDMSHPYRGLIHVSPVPIESAVAQLRR